ncbi:hypothetical protein ABB37_04848 [Leptomonas pyrrhocoris]|uniref:Uncharacterized protein n=1 Tax=Leptomonas pyrrhocoris TaxID=157538 RepID=A0A0M9G1W8_LEPPY|nr:hypothetical protein ABB37_04848 [Leptomonas pyrrhocoris]XP_015659104.1 hypothetical protein ABB37_04848 [Leptomonas pyrrhocoris]XP_015659105.1 hypothetical protein ABB37_04848 [Leptomonas pyrrhocoris]KPA80664.1 hypothetical protein ABB37_04848 [Leptomonas pyrrhocoris]KPA80665.1 hypothetical protein ABB37_04848 [Leptomonas pyrrhocoris]KPA80666.1 hypothetical protein ABB37_04848 [Leptomonas pyrrhocoris]|eukprot:XP_015659103.1 hypothetical protein ABB37_04848 [Leptomonas pyrrhocoris]
MDRFRHLRIVDSSDSDSEEEPTLQPHAQPPSDAARGNDPASASVGPGLEGSNAKCSPPSPPVLQSNEYAAPQENHAFTPPPPPQPSSEKGSSTQGTPSQQAVAPTVLSPKPHNPNQQAGETASTTSSLHRSRLSETPSAAQVSIKASSNAGMAKSPLSDVDRPAEELNASHDTVVEAKTGQTPPAASDKSSLQSSQSKTAPTQSAHSAAALRDEPSSIAANTGAAAGSEVALQFSPDQNSERDNEAVAAETQTAATRGSAADAAPLEAGAPTPANAESNTAPAAAAATEAPRKKKASAGCGPFSSSKKKKKAEKEKAVAQANGPSPAADADEPAPATEAPRKKKTSAACGPCSKKKADKKKVSGAGETADEQPADQAVDVAVDAAEGAAATTSPHREGSAGALSIPVAAGAELSEDPRSASQQEEPPKEEKSDLQHSADASAEAPATSTVTGMEEVPHQPPQENEAAAAAAADPNQATAPTPQTASSLSSASRSASFKEHADGAEEEDRMKKAKKSGEAESAKGAVPAAATADKGGEPEKLAKGHHTKRVKAVVRRKREKPKEDVAGDTTREDNRAKASDAKAHSTSRDAAQQPEEEKVSVKEATQGSKAASTSHLTSKTKASSDKLAAADSTAPDRASAKHSNKRASLPPSAKEPLKHSGSYGSHSSYSGSGSYSYFYSNSYTGSSERDASKKGKGEQENTVLSFSAPPLASSKHAAHSAPNPQLPSPPAASALQLTQQTEGSRPQNGAEVHFPRWSVRADDLTLREVELPATLPAYQRRILLDLRARERRDAEEAARDLQELTFRPRIHTLPGQEVYRNNLIEEDRSHSPIGGGGGGGGRRNESPSYSDVSPRRYSVRHLSPRLLEPRKAPPQPALPSFTPEITEYARKEVSHDRSVFQRLYNHSSPPSPGSAPTYSHRPEISDFAKQLYPVPRGRRLPSRPNESRSRDREDSGLRRESVFDRLYRQRNSPSTSPNTSPSRSGARPPSFHPQITAMAQRQWEGVPKEPVGDRLYRNARSPRRENRSPYHRDNDDDSRSDLLNGHRPHDNKEVNVNDQGEYDPQRDYATRREYGMGEAVVPQSDRTSWTSSSLSRSSFSMKGPASVKGELRRTFSEKQAAVEAV